MGVHLLGQHGDDGVWLGVSDVVGIDGQNGLSLGRNVDEDVLFILGLHFYVFAVLDALAYHPQFAPAFALADGHRAPHHYCICDDDQLVVQHDRARVHRKFWRDDHDLLLRVFSHVLAHSRHVLAFQLSHLSILPSGLRGNFALGLFLLCLRFGASCLYVSLNTLSATIFVCPCVA